MSRLPKRVVTLVAILFGGGMALLAMSPLIIRMSPVTSGFVMGLALALCLAGIGFGVWDARRIETRRKAKEDIWMKH